MHSLQAQTVRSSILVATSTPNRHIEAIARRHGVPVAVNPVSAGIASDWNFAYEQAHSDWVTLAHQDDTYSPEYTERCLAAAARAADPILLFTAAHESFEPDGPLALNARFKRVIAGSAFLGRTAIAGRFRKRLLLSLGNPVPCSSVMLHKGRIPDFRFQEGWKSNLDWRAWIELSEHPGALVYLREPLVQRMLHAGSATTRHLAARAREDARIFEALWPRPIARALSALFAASRWPYIAMGGDPEASEGERG